MGLIFEIGGDIPPLAVTTDELRYTRTTNLAMTRPSIEWLTSFTRDLQRVH